LPVRALTDPAAGRPGAGSPLVLRRRCAIGDWRCQRTQSRTSVRVACRQGTPRAQRKRVTAQQVIGIGTQRRGRVVTGMQVDQPGPGRLDLRAIGIQQHPGQLGAAHRNTPNAWNQKNGHVAGLPVELLSDTVSHSRRPGPCRAQGSSSVIGNSSPGLARGVRSGARHSGTCLRQNDGWQR